MSYICFKYIYIYIYILQTLSSKATYIINFLNTRQLRISMHILKTLLYGNGSI